MITFGTAILYITAAVSTIALIALLLKELKNSDALIRLVFPAIIACAGLLTFAYLLLTYYFVTSNFTYEYVWQYSSSDLPLIYKIAGTWAGQQGTYLLWVWVIFISAAWLAFTTKHATALARRTLIVTLIIGIYFIVITLLQTPFRSIYDFPDVPAGFVPMEGNGLNALLINFWMTVHPPLIFIGYAAITIPFAAAMVYLLTKEDGWEELSRQWARFTWLSLSMGIAVGGVWAYMVLGWGGFWSWDPVETASLIPWLTLTGYLHAAAMYRKNKRTFSIAAPILTVVSFVLVLYAAIVVRSGLFNTVHAFGETSTGTLLIIAPIATLLVSITLALRRYLEESEVEDTGFWNRTNIFYITLLLFVVLAFISFWGITFPVLAQLLQGVKVSVASDAKNFFNVWSYPFTILLLLVLGFCLNYKESEKESQKKNLFIVAGLTIITMFIRTENFYVLDHNSPFFGSEPMIYKIIGSISLLSIFPPLLYVAAGTYKRFIYYLCLGSLRPKIKGIGLTAVHIGVVFILLGAVVSTSFTQTIDRINIPLAAEGISLDVGNGYAVKLVDFSTRSLTETSYTPISEILSNPSSFGTVKISGKVTDVYSIKGHGTLVELMDNSGSIWVVFNSNITIPLNTRLTVSGSIISGFDKPVLSVEDVGELYKVQSVKLEVYENNKKIGSGVAEYLEGKGGSGTFPMVDSSITGTDVYVIFQGIGNNVVPLTLKIIPAVNFVWLGIVLFAIGIILIMAVKKGR